MRRILLADDSVTIQKVVELTFMEEDYEVVSVSNGTEALEKIDETAPDLLIADVHMPGANGYEVCRTAKDKLPQVPVLLLVGTFEPFDEAEASDAGADGFLKKPFDSQELLRRVDELLQDSEAEAEEDDATTMEAPADELQAPAQDEVPQGPGTMEVDALTDLEVDEDEIESHEAASEEEVAEVFAADMPEEVEDAVPLAEEAEAEGVEASLDDAPTKSFAMSPPAPPPEELEVVEEVEDLEVVDDVPEAEDEIQAEPEELEAQVPETEAPVAAAAVTETGDSLALSDEDVERIAKRVVSLLGQDVLREVAWEVVPDLAEVVIKARIRELESHLE